MDVTDLKFRQVSVYTERALLAQAAIFLELLGIANLTVVPANIERLRGRHILCASKRLRTPIIYVSPEGDRCAGTPR